MDRDGNRALRARFDDVFGQYQRLRAGMAELQDRLAAFAATARSPDGLVAATVDARGRLVALTFDPTVYRAHPPDRLARVATATASRAAASAADSIQELLAAYLPPGSGVAEYVRSGQFDALLRRRDG